MTDKWIEETAEHLSGVLMDTVGKLAAEHNLTTGQYLQAKAYHAHLEEYPFELVVEAMRLHGMFS
jgi:hypothetical protein